MKTRQFGGVGTTQSDAAILSRNSTQTRSQVLLVVALLVLQALDVATTAVGLRSGLQEANGFAAMLMSNHGEVWAYVLKAVATLTILAAILLLQRRYARLWVGLRIIAVYMFCVVAFNLLNIALVA